MPWNDREAVAAAVAEHGDDLAAILAEPVAANMNLVPPDEGFLAFLREQADASGALLVLDEVITGFRLGRDGAQGHYGVDADLTVLGKVIGGGFPLAALGGREEVMRELAPTGPVYQAGTLSGNPVAVRRRDWRSCACSPTRSTAGCGAPPTAWSRGCAAPSPTPASPPP